MSVPIEMPFWAEDWLTSESILDMTPAQEGAYIRLLAYCWLDKECSLPGEEEKLAERSRLGLKGWRAAEELQRNFVDHPKLKGRKTNPKLYSIWLREREKLAKAAENGKKGAAKRWRPQWGGHSDPNATPIASSFPLPPSYRERGARDPSTTTTEHESALGAEAHSTADLLISIFSEHNPQHQDKASWAVAGRPRYAIDLLQLNRDGVSWERMRAVADWLRTDKSEGAWWLGRVSDSVGFVRNFRQLEAAKIASAKKPSKPGVKVKTEEEILADLKAAGWDVHDASELLGESHDQG